MNTQFRFERILWVLVAVCLLAAIALVTYSIYKSFSIEESDQAENSSQEESTNPYEQTDLVRTQTQPSAPKAEPKVLGKKTIDDWQVEVLTTDQKPVKVIDAKTVKNKTQLTTEQYSILKQSSGDTKDFDSCLKELLTLQRIHRNDVSNDIKTTPWWKNKAELEYNGTAKIGDYYYFFDTPSNSCEDHKIANLYEATRVLLLERSLIIANLKNQAQ